MLLILFYISNITLLIFIQKMDEKNETTPKQKSNKQITKDAPELVRFCLSVLINSSANCL